MKYTSIYLVLFLTLISCQAKKKLNCSQLNWRRLGQEAALKGQKKLESLESKTSRCRERKPLIDKNSYFLGYKDGVKLYCKTSKGLEVGQSGSLYQNICPKNIEHSFLKGYINGRIKHLETELKEHKDRFIGAKDRSWRKEQEYLLIKNEDPEDAKMQKDFLEAYQEEAGQLKKKITQLKKELIYLKRKKIDLNFK